MKNNFIKIYSTLNPTEAHIIKFLFENNGIEAIIDNDKINFFFGIISAQDAMAEIWVPEKKYKKAIDLLFEKSSLDITKLEQIDCPLCGEKNCGLFDFCWKCLADLRTGEHYKPGHSKIDDSDRASKKRHISLYILLLLMALLAACYLAYMYCSAG